MTIVTEYMFFVCRFKNFICKACSSVEFLVQDYELKVLGNFEGKKNQALFILFIMEFSLG